MIATTGTILDQIVADVRAGNSAACVPTLPVVLPPIRSLRGSIEAMHAHGVLGVIAEHKRRSPSRGLLAADGDEIATRVNAYEGASAVGISILTEPDHFAGSMADLSAARMATDSVPLLCKDFIIDESQLVRARAHGADAVLLIAALHDAAALVRLVRAAHTLSLEVLLEVHDADELERALATDADLIGINARDLRSFEVDLGVVEQLAPLVTDRPAVAESGIATAEDAQRVQRGGAAAVLVGERLMSVPNPRALISSLMVRGAE